MCLGRLQANCIVQLHSYQLISMIQQLQAAGQGTGGAGSHKPFQLWECRHLKLWLPLLLLLLSLLLLQGLVNSSAAVTVEALGVQQVQAAHAGAARGHLKQSGAPCLVALLVLLLLVLLVLLPSRLRAVLVAACNA
jgi:hypothetical protein